MLKHHNMINLVINIQAFIRKIEMFQMLYVTQNVWNFFKKCSKYEYY